MFRKNKDTIVIAILFVIAAELLTKFGFWKAIGLPAPTGLIFTGLMFLSLVIILQYTLFEPFMAISNERFVQTSEKRKNADEKKIQAENMFKSYEQSLLTAKMDALKMHQQIAMEGEEQERKILDEAKKRSKQNLDSSMKEIEIQIEQAEKSLAQSTGMLVEQVVQETLAPGSKKTGQSMNKSVESRM